MGEAGPGNWGSLGLGQHHGPCKGLFSSSPFSSSFFSLPYSPNKTQDQDAKGEGRVAELFCETLTIRAFA